MNPQELQLTTDTLAAGPVAVTVGEHCIGVFDVDGTVYAIENICPHADAYLSDGHVQGPVVECALHNARFHIPTGKCLSGPGRDIATFPVRVTQNRIDIELSDDQKENRR